MNIAKIFIPLFVSIFFSLSSHATGFQMPFSWAERENGSAAVIYTSDYDNDPKYFESEIGHSRSGQQGIYFRNYYVEDMNTCSYESSLPKNTTMIFSGQAVKMLSWCKKFSDTDRYYLELTPATERGDHYVINLFKVAILPIEIMYDDDTISFPVTGFTKAWNSAGGNAI